MAGAADDSATSSGASADTTRTAIESDHSGEPGGDQYRGAAPDGSAPQGSPATVTATFSAVDPDVEVADAIGNIFDAILTRSRPYRSRDFPELDVARQERLVANTAELPSKVEYNGRLSLFDPYDPEAFSIFAA